MDVTAYHATACTAPLTLCIASYSGSISIATGSQNIKLKYCDRATNQLLGVVFLRFSEAISLGNSKFFLFRIRGSSNYCLPKSRLWAHFLLHAYAQAIREDPPDIRMSLCDYRAALVKYICPHAQYLGSVGSNKVGNIFPMKISGELGNGYFGFALRETLVPARLVDLSRHLVVTTVPLSQASLPFKLVSNEKKESIEWAKLPFRTELSTIFQIPAPIFAVRVREIEVESSTLLGSHRFFVGRVVSDETRAATCQLFVVHGFYQHWRLRGNPDALRVSLADHVNNTRRIAPGLRFRVLFPVDSLPLP